MRRPTLLPRWVYTAGWVGIGAAAAIWELLSLLDRGTGDTLSEHIWRLLERWPELGVPILALLGWAAYHLVLSRVKRK